MRSDARKRAAEPTTEDRDCGAIGCRAIPDRDEAESALGAALILLDRTEQALRIVKADLDAQAVQLDEIRRVAAEWAEDDWPQVDDYLRGHAAGMRAAGGAILGRLG
jgi:hypothetical protein